ncbi:MAG: GntR family transcriptional regulator [Chloroflexi bacterium]|nr:GntR family transcriptional regulator [Chloroflexota bacterium]MCL5109128.1 GntR family transcriptional regulator [Chloroflexota bacterium]
MQNNALPRLQPHRNLTETVYDALKEAIVEGSLGAGCRLTEGALASSFGVSTTPVREALTRLEREGLVTLLPRRGAMVTSFSVDDIVEAGELRELLEGFALSKGWTRLTSEVIDRLRALVTASIPFVESEDRRAFNRLDVEFHTLIVETSGNKRLIGLFGTLHDQFQMIRLRTVRLDGRPRAAHEEHGLILAALTAGDAREAERLLRAHIRHTAADLVSALRDVPASSQDAES